MFFSFFFSECLSGNITTFVTPKAWGMQHVSFGVVCLEIGLRVSQKTTNMQYADISGNRSDNFPRGNNQAENLR